MIDNSSISYIDYNNNSECKWKELLYNLFYEIKSEILGKRIEIDEDEYLDNIKKISIPKLITYIHDSIKILISTKIDLSKRQQKLEDEKFYLHLNDQGYISKKLDQDEKLKYENILKKLEEKERFLTKIKFHNILQKEAMENKILEYMEIEEEFEEMKEKLKYENGRFLDNERKDNEIIIIRSENSKLKNTINDLEKQNKNYEYLVEQLNIKINLLNEEISKLKIKIEEKQAEINLTQNCLNKEKNNFKLNHNKENNSVFNRNLLEYEENSSQTNMSERLKKGCYVNIQIDKGEKEKCEHNNTVKYYKYKNMNLHPYKFSKIKPKKIYSYKKKSENKTNNNNEKKSTKENTYANLNSNDILSITRNDNTEKLKPKIYKYFSGNNITKIKNNSCNKKSNYFPMNNSHIQHGKFSYLFNNKININNLCSMKKLLAYGSIRSLRTNSSKQTINKNKVLSYRSSSGE